MAWKTDNDLENSDPVPNSGDDTEWPCKPIVESSGWPTSWTNDSNKSKLKNPSPTPEDEAANNSQLPALLVVAEYLNSKLNLDDDDEFSEYIGEDGEFLVNVDEEENGFQDYDFFAKLFKEDDGLREYYEKNWESGGIFCCLVCCGVREKGWKRFKDCSSLVQHSTSIAKTSKRRAHRAYCKVVCEVLGWDVNQLPSIVPSVVDKKVKAEWPCKPVVESSGWPSSWENDSNKSKLQTPAPTPEDEAANNSQLPALLLVAKYLNSTLCLDDDDEFVEYIGEDGQFFINGDEEENGFQDYDFFAKLFKEDDGLREYYEKNKENGIFCCLVCCGVREKGWKRFKDCSSLVQHSTSIAKTSKRRAHRAYCKVVCEVLGWDVNQLPSIVPSVVDKKVKAEWPCKPVVESSGWPSSWENDSNKSKLQTPAPTPEDEAANNSQLPALLLVAKYLNSTLCLDDDDEFVEYIGEDGQFFINGDEEENGFQDYDFFAKLFKEDDGLREYYEKNKENGIFCCLVCCGVREKGWKRFKDCSSLVQHSISIAKTSKRRAHRAYCKVVCEVLGWDVNSLPTIVPSAGDTQVKAQGNVDDGGDDSLNTQCKSPISGSISDAEASLSKLSLIDENQQGKDCCSAKLEHNSLSGATVDRSLGDLSKGISETTEENAEGVVNCAENSVTKAGVDGLLEGLSDLTLETQKGNAKGAL
ncbi:uncharacterized protein LOC107878587 isoform X2 [Capsicum annuum]|uniref:uncharacterized protein LOC107878587 isoform X2 n=1 Tax=Capsicum annuum TaxID=4072 RepID=UPI0007BFD4F2|nr:uncharacterized protein LOC107878587 isoform X2 [Capsicum annuum]